MLVACVRVYVNSETRVSRLQLRVLARKSPPCSAFVSCNTMYRFQMSLRLTNKSFTITSPARFACMRGRVCADDKVSGRAQKRRHFCADWGASGKAT